MYLASGRFAGESEVNKLDMTLRRDQDILRLLLRVRGG